MAWKVQGWSWPVPVHGRITEKSVPRANQLRPLVPHEVGELGRLVADPVEDDVLPPGTLKTGLAGILVPGDRGGWEANDEDVVPAVPVEIVDKREEIVGIAISILHDGPVDLVLLHVVRASVPIRPGDYVHDAVPVNVPKVGALAVIVAGQLFLFERVNEASFRTWTQARPQEKKNNAEWDGVPCHH